MRHFPSRREGKSGTAAPMRLVTVYTDYKSPYAYLAKDPTYEMAAACGATLD